MVDLYRKGRDKHKGENAPWYVDIKVDQRRRQTFNVGTDYKKGLKRAHELELRYKDICLGLIDPRKEKMAAELGKPTSHHIEEFRKKLVIRKRTVKHVDLIIGRITRIVEGCGFTRLEEINAEAVEEFLNNYCEVNDFGPKTYNHYCEAFVNFAKILPNLGLQKLRLTRRNCAVDVRKKRRALSPEELEKLIESARTSGKTIQGYDGETRARIYEIAYATGLRRSELASLTPASFELSSKKPTVTIEATISKRRRKDTLPLHPKLVPSLKEWLVGVAADQFLFPKLNKRRTWLMVKLDLERIGIPYETQEGYADFHAAGRHTYITNLIKSGASLAVTKELARHSDLKMTLRYTHLGLDDQAEALKFLPLPSKPKTNNEQHPLSTNANESRED